MTQVVKGDALAPESTRNSSQKRPRDARTNPYATATCTTCGGPIVLPRAGSANSRSKSKNHEGQWIHVDLSATLHVAVAPKNVLGSVA
jgi:hypothetical protein